jgi:hypothetical protein
MGINNDFILCYGIEFSYDEIEHLKNNDEVRKISEDIDTDYMPNLWSELGFISGSPYYDSEEDHRNYIIGKEIIGDLSLDEFVTQINTNETNLYIKNVCEKYSLPYKEPKILCRVDVN